MKDITIRLSGTKRKSFFYPSRKVYALPFGNKLRKSVKDSSLKKTCSCPLVRYFGMILRYFGMKIYYDF